MTGNARQEVARSLGPDAKVWRIKDKSTVEIRDLDDLTSKEEMLSEVSRVAGGGAIRFVSLRRAFENA